MAPQSKRLPVRFTPAAADDLDVAFAYVNDTNRAAAGALLERLTKSVARLSDFPEMGTPLPPEECSFVNPGVRFVVVEPYLIFYRIADDGVVILRLLHSRHDSLGALFE